MKKIGLLFISALCFHSSFGQKNIEGIWQGKLNVATTSIRLVVHIKKEAEKYLATMDSPDQGAKDIPFSTVWVEGDSVLMEMKAIGGKLSGRFTSDTTFSGRWFQGTSLPLDLKKLAASEVLAEMKRPQTPKPPFPYKSEDVVYTNKDKSIQYGATVTSPQGNGPFPALLLITGSGQQNRDEEIFGHKPFAVLADYLTRKGYVVMRVDDRGVGQTTGDVKKATSKDFAGDALVSLNYLKALPQVSKTKLGLLGHSEGGMIAQIVAAQRADVAFVIMLAGPGEKIIDLMGRQNKAVLQNTGLSEKAIDGYVDLYNSMGLVVALAPTDTAAKLAALPVLNNWLKKTPADVVAATTNIKTEGDKQTFITEFAKTFRAPWFNYFIKYNPDVYVQKMKAKVLALNGEKDIQVAPEQNLAGLKASLQKGGNKNFETMELKGLNHLFQHCQKCTVAEYGVLEETMAPEVLETIAQWLEKNVK
jgi:pimeloyl-ACP methyl ester carboxylesterase